MKIFIAMSATAAAPKRRPAPKVTSERSAALDAKRMAKYEAQDQKTLEAIKPLLPEGIKVRRFVYSHMGVNMSGVYVVGKTDKVRSLQFEVVAGKLTVLQCPANFIGKNKYETWPVEGMEKIALTAANVKKALKKFGFI